MPYPQEHFLYDPRWLTGGRVNQLDRPAHGGIGSSDTPFDKNIRLKQAPFIDTIIRIKLGPC
jgi:hypothetical protein